MKINLEFNGLSELDEFVTHYVKTKAVQTTAAVAPKAEVTKAETVKEVTKVETPKTPKAPATPKAEKVEKEEAAEGLNFADHVAPKIIKLADSKGRDAAVALLKKFGVTKGPQLTPDQFPEFIAAVDAALGEDE